MNRTVDNNKKRNAYGRWPLWKLILAYAIVGLFVYGAAYAIFFKRPTTDNAAQQSLSQPAGDQSDSDTPPIINDTTQSSDSTNSGGGFFNY